MNMTSTTSETYCREVTLTSGREGAPPFSPFALLRVAALPCEVLTHLSPILTPSHLQRVLVHMAKMETLRLPIEDALYGIVPRIESAQRGAALDIRRAVHNGRFCSPTAEVRAALRAVSEDAYQLLELWLTEAQRAVEAVAETELCLEKEVNDITRPGLWTVAQRPEFLRALAHASPDLARSLSREHPKPCGVQSNKIERSLLAYLIRAAAKTSPFGVFMHQAVFAVDPECKSDRIVMDPAERSSRSYLNPGLRTVLHGGAYGCCGKPDHSTYIVNPTLSWNADNVGNAVVSPLIVVGGRIWRAERQVAIRLHARVAEVLRDLPCEFSWDTLSKRLTLQGLTPEMADRLAQRLFAKGFLLLAPALVDDRTSSTPTALGRLGDCSSPVAAEIRIMFKEMENKASDFSSASANCRLALVDEVAERFRKVLAAVNMEPPSPNLSLIMEDGRFTGSYGPIGGDVTKLLNQLRSAFRDFVIVRSQYATLRQLFLTLFGSGGICTDVVGFLRQASRELLFKPSDWVARGEHVKDISAARPAVSVLLQLSTGPEETVAVLNHVFTGPGWLSSRHATGQGAGPETLARQLQEWLRSAKYPREPVDFRVCSDCNPLQSHPQLTERSLIWPGELDGNANRIPVAETVLTHNEKSGLLEISDKNGVPLAPVYLGATIPTPLWGARYWLTVLAEPFAVDLAHTVWVPPARHIDVEHRPRHQSNEVVLSRECWWMRADRMRRVWFADSGAKLLAHVAADCRSLGIPRFFFARGVLAAEDATSRDFYKPLWIDTVNPFCLDILASTAEHVEWLILSEVLPRPETMWTPFEGQTHVTELLVEVLI